MARGQEDDLAVFKDEFSRQLNALAHTNYSFADSLECLEGYTESKDGEEEMKPQFTR